MQNNFFASINQQYCRICIYKLMRWLRLWNKKNGSKTFTSEMVKSGDEAVTGAAQSATIK